MPPRKTQRCVCRARTDFARARSNPRNDGERETGGEYDSGQTFCAEDLCSIPSLLPGSRYSADAFETQKKSWAIFESTAWASGWSRAISEAQGFALSSLCLMKLCQFARLEFLTQNYDARLKA